MNSENVLFQSSGLITDFSQWDDIIHETATQFKKQYLVYPNILLASQETYRKIDLNAQIHPERLQYEDDVGDFETSPIPYDGLSSFVGPDYTLEFCQEPDLYDGHFTLVYDETPDFDGEPEEEPNEIPDKSYIYRTA
jgi:hypothetical protein